MKNGIYSECNLVVSNAIKGNARVISLDRLAGIVMQTADFRKVSEEELREAYVRQALSTTLSDKKWCSVVRGKGFYVDIEKCRKEYKKVIADNISGDIERDMKLLEIINKGLETAEIDGQMAFNPETMQYEEEMTRSELLEMLEAESKQA